MAEQAGKTTGPKNPVKRMKQALKADVARLEDDPESFGFTESQREAMIAEQTQPARTSAQGQSSQLARDALAADGFQAGEFAEAQRAVAEEVGQATAAAAPAVRDLHNQVISREKERITQEVKELQARRQENARFWAQFGVDTAATIGNLVSSVSGGAKPTGDA